MTSPTKLFKIAISLIALQICFLVKGSSSKNDKITSLPGQPPVSFNQYSGYITVDDKAQRNLFYYFAEAELDPHTKPLVLWLTGGPGCASVGVGAFTENGPFQPKGDGTLKRNNFSWNKVANILYLDSPAGVGFSYSTNESFYSYINDNMTAQDNLNFMLRWLEAYPEYKSRDFFIAGDSYGGHFVPQLASLVLGSKLKSNLKGIAIGNPLLEFNADSNARGEYLWSHGLISDSTYAMLNTICNYSEIYRQTIQGKFSPSCLEVSNQVDKEVGSFINIDDVTINVCLSSNSTKSSVLNPQETDDGIDVCVEDKATTYLNNKDVQLSLNAKLVGVVSNSSLCSYVINYDLKDLEVPTLPILSTLLKSGVRVLVYSGDQDSDVPLTGTRPQIISLAKELGLNTTAPYRVWLQNHQVGGWTQVYSDMLSYATIRGGAHLAPRTQPERSLLLFSTFLAGKQLPQAN